MITRTTVETTIDEDIAGDDETKDILVLWDPAAAGLLATLDLWVDANDGSEFVNWVSRQLLAEVGGGVSAAASHETSSGSGSATHSFEIVNHGGAWKLRGYFASSQTVHYKVRAVLTIQE